MLVHVWIDEGELRAGDSIIARIAEAISEVEFVVALVSEHSCASKWCSKELSLAINQGLEQGRVRVLPLRIDDTEMPDSLRDVLYLQVNSRNPNRVINRLVADVGSHQRDLLDHLETKTTHRPLSLKSSLDAAKLKGFRSDLLSEKAADDGFSEEAMEALMNDYSVPAMNVLFEATIADVREKLHLGYGLAGLVYLAPVTAPWLRKLLTHRNSRVVLDTLDLFFPPMWDYVLRKTQRATFEDIKRLGHWVEVKSRVIGVAGKARDKTLLGRVKLILTETEQRSRKKAR